MSPELDKELCEKYPKIFKNRDGSIMQTCMAWGFECGDGWYNVIDTLCSEIQHYVDFKSRDLSEEEKQSFQVVAEQVKEKFGTLRFYFYGGDETVEGMVSMAESITRKICEDCGNVGKHRTKGWHKVVCEPCEEKRKNLANRI